MTISIFRQTIPLSSQHKSYFIPYYYKYLRFKVCIFSICMTFWYTSVFQPETDSQIITTNDKKTNGKRNEMTTQNYTK